MRPVFVTLTAASYGLDPSEGAVILKAHSIDAITRRKGDEVTEISLERTGARYFVTETPEQVRAIIDKAFRTKAK